MTNKTPAMEALDFVYKYATESEMWRIGEEKEFEQSFETIRAILENYDQMREDLERSDVYLSKGDKIEALAQIRGCHLKEDSV